MRVTGYEATRLIDAGEFETARARPVAANLAPAAAPGDQAKPFGEVLGAELQRVNDLLVHADQQAQRVATGDAGDLHQALLAVSEADLALQVTMRVTQKAIAAYQEVSRMQI